MMAARALLPTQCAVCRSWDHERLCRVCTERFAGVAPRCTRCALRVPAGQSLCGNCVLHAPAFDETVAVADYAYPWDELVSRFKFHAALDIAGMLAQCMARAVAQAGGPPPHCIVPVPLAPGRLRERGYNQAWELARRLGRRMDCRADAVTLSRVKDTPHQLALPRDQRAANVRAAFLVEPGRAARIRDCDVAVVDDVMTTGATANEVARTLKRAGAARVRLWIVARTPAH
jgi:ComF family protein